LKRFVLDASLALAPFLDDPVPDLAIRVRRSLEGGSRATVPPLWILELANGFAIAERRGALSASFIERCMDNIEDLMASVIEQSATVVSLRQAFSTACAFRLSAYDAVYLETAQRENLPLATLDRALAQAATRAGVPLFS
jgi:predicted nucleic acid-binding protein